MMEDLNEKLAEEFEQYELFSQKDDSLLVEVKNGVLKQISSGGIRGKSLRVIKNGRLGSNFTMGSSPENTKTLYLGAGQSADFGPEVVFSFSGAETSSKEPPPGQNGLLLDYAGKLLAFLKENSADIPVNIYISEQKKTLSIKTSRQGNCRGASKIYSLHLSSPVPGGGAEVSKSVFSRNIFSGLPVKEAEEFIHDYENSRRVSIPKKGRLPVLFSPEALFLFLFCLQEGASGKNIYLKMSPLADKKGSKVFSEKIHVSDEPRMEDSPHSRDFDDEGVVTRGKTIVKNGILENFIYDLNYGSKLEAGASGNALKSSLFSSGIGTPVSPAFINPFIKPGPDNIEDVIGDLREGVIVNEVMGFHSSNYTQGHFSVQAHGFHVSGGKIRGRLEDVMISGNIYDDFKNVAAVGERLFCTSFGHVPYVLINDVSVSGE
jgi:PmbA protein